MISIFIQFWIQGALSAPLPWNRCSLHTQIFEVFKLKRTEPWPLTRISHIQTDYSFKSRRVVKYSTRSRSSLRVRISPMSGMADGE